MFFIVKSVLLLCESEDRRIDDGCDDPGALRLLRHTDVHLLGEQVDTRHQTIDSRYQTLDTKPLKIYIYTSHQTLDSKRYTLEPKHQILYTRRQLVDSKNFTLDNVQQSVRQLILDTRYQTLDRRQLILDRRK